MKFISSTLSKPVIKLECNIKKKKQQYPQKWLSMTICWNWNNLLTCTWQHLITLDATSFWHKSSKEGKKKDLTVTLTWSHWWYIEKDISSELRQRKYLKYIIYKTSFHDDLIRTSGKENNRETIIKVMSPEVDVVSGKENNRKNDNKTDVVEVDVVSGKENNAENNNKRSDVPEVDVVVGRRTT